MSWLDTLLDRAKEAQGETPAAPRSTGSLASPVRVKPEIKVAWFQTAPPRNGDCGGVEAVHYFVVDGSVNLCDESGKPTGATAPLPDGADVRATAARIGRRRWLASNDGPRFNRIIDYGPLGLA